MKPLEAEMAALFAAKTPFLIVDTETTGLPWKDRTAQIIEISCVNQDGEVVLSSLVKPDVAVPAAMTKVHGLRDSDLVNSPTFPEIWPQLLAVLSQVETVYAYNKDFDHGMVLHTAERFGLDIPEFLDARRWSCMMEAYATYFGDWNSHHRSYRWQKLSLACARLGVPMSEAHRATGDCLSTLALMKALAARGAIASTTA